MAYLQERITITEIQGHKITPPLQVDLTEEDKRHYATANEIDPFLVGKGTTPESAQGNLEKAIAEKPGLIEEMKRNGRLNPA